MKRNVTSASNTVLERTFLPPIDAFDIVCCARNRWPVKRPMKDSVRLKLSGDIEVLLVFRPPLGQPVEKNQQWNGWKVSTRCVYSQQLRCCWLGRTRSASRRAVLGSILRMRRNSALREHNVHQMRLSSQYSIRDHIMKVLLKESTTSEWIFLQGESLQRHWNNMSSTMKTSEFLKHHFPELPSVECCYFFWLGTQLGLQRDLPEGLSREELQFQPNTKERCYSMFWSHLERRHFVVFKGHPMKYSKLRKVDSFVRAANLRRSTRLKSARLSVRYPPIYRSDRNIQPPLATVEVITASAQNSFVFLESLREIHLMTLCLHSSLVALLL